MGPSTLRSHTRRCPVTGGILADGIAEPLAGGPSAFASVGATRRSIGHPSGEGQEPGRLAAALPCVPVDRLILAVPSEVRRAESFRSVGRPLGSLGPWLAAGDAPTRAKPATFELRSGS